MVKKITLGCIVALFTLGSTFAQKIDKDKGSFMINAGLDFYRVPRAKFFQGHINPTL